VSEYFASTARSAATGDRCVTRSSVSASSRSALRSGGVDRRAQQGVRFGVQIPPQLADQVACGARLDAGEQVDRAVEHGRRVGERRARIGH
jgi:hypothetical protein